MNDERARASWIFPLSFRGNFLISLAKIFSRWATIDSSSVFLQRSKKSFRILFWNISRSLLKLKSRKFSLPSEKIKREKRKSFAIFASFPAFLVIDVQFRSKPHWNQIWVIYWKYFWNLIEDYLDNLARIQLSKLRNNLKTSVRLLWTEIEKKIEKNLKLPSATCINNRGNHQQESSIILINWSAPEEMGAMRI